MNFTVMTYMSTDLSILSIVVVTIVVVYIKLGVRF